jgi:hypothetical protein
MITSAALPSGSSSSRVSRCWKCRIFTPKVPGIAFFSNEWLCKNK